LTIRILRDLVHGKAGVDIIALLAMAGAIALHEYLAGSVVALMLVGGQTLEDYASGRARRELSQLVERMPRSVHRREGTDVVSRPLEGVLTGDLLLVQPGEVVPVDGLVTAPATLDESAITGEARPVEHAAGDKVASGTVNVGSPFDLRATATADTSSYAGIVRLVREAQESKAPFTRMADRYAMVFLPLTLLVAGVAWAISGDATRALSVLVVATPCPLILAAPVALVSGISRAARRSLGSPVWAFPGDLNRVELARVRRRASLDGSSTVFVGVDEGPEGVLILDDPIRPDARRTLRLLRQMGIRRIVMVTGDALEVAEMVGTAVGADEVLAERSPAEKVEAIALEGEAAPTLMVGDGINDAPALAAANVGIALGARGMTAHSEAADVVITVDRLDRVADAIRIARGAKGIALKSVLVGMGLSVAAMIAAAGGLLTPLAGALLQEAIDIAVILNALRALGDGKRRSVVKDATGLADQFRQAHRELASGIEELRTLADRLDRLDPATALDKLRAARDFLIKRVLPHEEMEGKVLYPLMTTILGGDDPTKTMAREHLEIKHLIGLLESPHRRVGPCRSDGRGPLGTAPGVYGLHAILRMHTVQEDESYLSRPELG